MAIAAATLVLQPAADAADDDDDEPADDDRDDEDAGCPDRFPERGIGYELRHRRLLSEVGAGRRRHQPGFD